ncbi:MAG TPA: hypothetical protein VKM55_05085 [Candidatus Lokiarchaeia archaeon]|nr:hypothetical protein [Candidatus Lokiarchaeia archaeon]
MKKIHVFFVILILGLFLRALFSLGSSFLPTILVPLVDLLGTVLLYIATAYFFWNLAIYLYQLRVSHDTEFPGVMFEDFTLRVEELGHDVFGTLLSSMHSDEATPLVIAMTGGGGKHEDLFGTGAMLVQSGVKVLLFDHPGIVGKSHGTNPASKVITAPKSILALRKVMDYALARDDIKTSNVGLFGGSLGAFTAVYGGFSDPRVKVIVGECTGLLENAADLKRMKKSIPLWFKQYCKSIKLDTDSLASLDIEQFSKSGDQALKNRIYLVHAKDDYAVPYWAHENLKKALELPDENCLVFEKGGHGLFDHQSMLAGWIIDKLRRHLF